LSHYTYNIHSSGNQAEQFIFSRWPLARAAETTKENTGHHTQIQHRMQLENKRNEVETLDF